VNRICAQPFLLAMWSNDVEHKHIPDLLLITDQGTNGCGREACAQVVQTGSRGERQSQELQHS
jgi:hypothetical protein